MTVSDQTLRRIGWTLCGLSIVAVPIAMVLVASAGALDESIDNDTLAFSLSALCFGGFGVVLVQSEPRNGLVWIFVAIGGLCSGGYVVAVGVAEVLAEGQGVGLKEIDPSGWPSGVPTLFAHVFSVWTFAFWGLPTLGLLLVPDGRLLSRRWLPVAAATWLAIAVEWLVFAATWPADSDEAIALQGNWVEGLHGLAILVLLLSLAASCLSLALRYRRAGHEIRRRLRWVLLGGALFLLAFFLVDALAPLDARIPASALVPILVVSLGLAIWRDQLFDVDVVISRTLLFGFLAVFIGAAYVSVVFGVGALIGHQNGDNQALSLVATVVVAFAFQPVRRRLERAANRLVYGPRATPYEVLADLSGRLARTEATDGLFERMALMIAEGSGAERVVVWRWSGSDYEPLAGWPVDVAAARTRQLSDGDGTGDERVETVVSIHRSGQRLGALTVTKARGDELNPTERRLLDDLAGSAALVMDRIRLDTALGDRANALERSRRRLVKAQDEERQRLEHQLNVGTQQRLEMLADGLDASVGIALGEGRGTIATQIAALVEETRTAKVEIRTLAQGMYPPVLEANGLTAAVEVLTETIPVPVALEVIGAGRPDLDVELAVYFCIAEALTNVVKHAHATEVTVRLDHQDGVLAFGIQDDGAGFHTNQAEDSSTGLEGLLGRIDAIGGRLTITSAPGCGTTVAGMVPCRAMATVG